ncbi:MAG TPA: hypothetical protein VIB08_05170 [Thermoanaerobaculia bacterium]
MALTLKNPAELVSRIGVPPEQSFLLVDAPEELVSVLASSRPADDPPETVAADRLRAVKGDFDAVLVWREDRVGSQALLTSALRHVRRPGVLWVVTAMRKVQGPKTAAAHRLDRSDLEKAFSRSEFVLDREARFSAWHVGYRFRRS